MDRPRLLIDLATGLRLGEHLDASGHEREHSRQLLEGAGYLRLPDMRRLHPESLVHGADVNLASSKLVVHSLLGELTHVIQPIDTGELDQVRFDDDQSSRTGHVDHHRLASIVQGCPRGISAGDRHRPGDRVPSLQGIESGEREKAAATVCRHHRHDRHMAGLVGAGDLICFFGGGHDGGDHTAGAQGVEQLLWSLRRANRLIGGSVVIVELTGLLAHRDSVGATIRQ